MISLKKRFKEYNKFLFCGLFVFIFVFVFSGAGVIAAGDENDSYSGYNIELESGIKVVINGEQMTFEVAPALVNDRTMLPMRAIFEALKADVYWDEGTETITAVKGDKNVVLQILNTVMTIDGERVILDVPPLLLSDRTMVPARAVSDALGCLVEWEEDTQTVYIDAVISSELDDTVISDDYRYSNYNGEYNTVSIFDNYDGDYFGMELLNIPNYAADEYVAMVNATAENLPDVNVSCMIVPTAAEFYAQKDYKTHYLKSMRYIYDGFSDKINAVNVEKTLMEHAGEDIYFKTDHHWTQRGAYYAYREFINSIGLDIEPLSEFKAKYYDYYLGSWSKATFGTPGYDMISANPDGFEVFYPLVDYEGVGYMDMDLKIIDIYDLDAVNDGVVGYNAFLEGDSPLQVYSTSAGTGRSIAIVKESFGNALATWALNNYSSVFVIDYRMFDGTYGDIDFSLSELCDRYKFDDVLIVSYPNTILADDLRKMLATTLK